MAASLKMAVIPVKIIDISEMLAVSIFTAMSTHTTSECRSTSTRLHKATTEKTAILFQRLFDNDV
jgi:hypothetical protein